MGSAIQPKLHTVQGILQNALNQINITEKTIFSGRTDKNVHAQKQVVSVKIPLFWNDLRKLQTTLTHLLPKEIHILQIKKVDDSFHARFSAKKREYRYIISTQPSNSFTSNYVHFEKNLDIQKMIHASKLFLGSHDFNSFCKMGSEPSSTIRTIYKIDIYTYKEFIVIKFQANAYLRSQIRMMVDFLLKIAKNKLTTHELQEQLDNKKTHSNTLAPPFGLYLSNIIY